MTCRDFADFLDRYLGGELPAEFSQRFDQHLRVCRDCRNYLDTYRQTIKAGRAALGAEGDPIPATVPQGLVAAILAARMKARP